MMSERRGRSLWRLPAIVFAVLLLTGCASLQPGFETPTVRVASFRAIPGSGVVPNFEIGLQVINPNARALPLRGVSYAVAIEGRELLTGVGSDLPVVPGYGEGEVTLTAVPNLLQSLSFFNDLLNRPRDRFRYELSAKLDVGGLLPAIRIADTGEFNLQGAVAR